VTPNPTEIPTPAPTGLPTIVPSSVPTPKPTFKADRVRWSTGKEGIYSPGETGFVTSSSLTFIPPQRCTPTEIVVKFKLDFNLTSGDKIAIGLAGFTSGECDNVEGQSITAELDEVENLLAITPGDLKLFPHNKFLGGYREGLMSTGYQDSRLTFVVRPGVKFVNGSEIVINVDQGNYLKANCGIDAGGNNNFTISVQGQQLGRWTDAYGIPQVASAITNAVINESTYISGGCPITDTKLRLEPPRPKHLSDLTLSFKPGMHLNPLDNVTVTLGGFTSGNATGLGGGKDIPMGGLKVTTVVSRFNRAKLEYTFKSGTVFNASWSEGEPEVNKPGYNNSRLKLMVNRGYTFLPGVEFEVLVHKSNGIKANCGTPGNYEGIKIAINVQPDPTYPRASKSGESIGFRQAPRGSIQTIGDGCRSFLGFCHGNGECDYCRNVCQCNKGFGHASDTFDRRAKPRDCSGRVCPSGPSFTNIVPKVVANSSGHAEANVARGGRVLAECSGVGTCDYLLGECQCPAGWAGSACERRQCPGGDLNPCSGHGACLNMKQLALARDALPLANSKGSGPAGHYYTSGGIEQSPASWDSFSLHGCLCDSSWPVGLGANETQEPEYFGPNCARRHCPTGDDPLTLGVNELDCAGVVAEGGRGVGLAGNACHVDCSNRGACDYEQGTCTCFEGFFGANCGTPYSAFTLQREVLRDYVGNDNVAEALAEIQKVNDNNGAFP